MKNLFLNKELLSFSLRDGTSFSYDQGACFIMILPPQKFKTFFGSIPIEKDFNGIAISPNGIVFPFGTHIRKKFI